jgi:putative ABC transport system substrate-binding protein
VRRRDFIKAIATTVAGWPLVAHAQKPAKAPLIGVLWPNPPSQFEPIRQGLKDLGYVEGKNIGFEFRWAEGALDKLPEMALDLVHIPVDLIVTLSPPATVAAQRATRTIPVVFVAMGDPVKRSGSEPRATRRKSHWNHPNDCRDEHQTCGDAQGGISRTLQFGCDVEPE